MLEAFAVGDKAAFEDRLGEDLDWLITVSTLHLTPQFPNRHPNISHSKSLPYGLGSDPLSGCLTEKEFQNN
jgi:hypothetical protein